MDLLNFSFIEETVSENAVSMNSGGLYQIDMLTKFYNLFLLYFYFQVMVFIIGVVQRAVRKQGRFDR